MKILHLASFIGNIGDNASHLGLYGVLRTLLPRHRVSGLEMRRFYKNYRLSDRRAFDRAFVAFANQHDLLIIGGGGFLDYFIAGSQTGTTLDIDPALVSGLRVPTLICSVGSNPHQPVPEGNVEKFRGFLDAVLAHPTIRLSVRNDGSLQSLASDIGPTYASRIPQTLDSGFFFAAGRRRPLPWRNYVAVNLTTDQLAMQRHSGREVDPDRYRAGLLASLDFLCATTDKLIVFVPHIPSDLQAIWALVSRMDDNRVRQRVRVAPLMQGMDGAMVNFSIYAHSDLVIATRLHANICSMTAGRPTIGLVALDRIGHVYRQFDIADRTVDLTTDFSPRLNELITRLLTAHDAAPLLRRIEAEKALTVQHYRRQLQDFGLVAAG